MKQDDHFSNLRKVLEEFGYSTSDQDRVVDAGITNVDNAIDYIARNQEFQTTEQNSSNLPSAHHTNQPTSSSSSMKVEGMSNSESRGIGKARDSIDRGRVQTPDHFGNRTASTDSDLQKAIMLSRREQEERDTAEALKRSKQQVSAPGEDPDFMRAIEESLKESHARSGNDRGVTWQSHSFPDIKDRLRGDLNQPVGLKNIGNTCYLNSLLQVYYHLPDFRRAIMSFLPPKDLASSPKVQVDPLPTQNSADDMMADALMDSAASREKLEQKLASSHPDQSFNVTPNGDEFVVNSELRSQVASLASHGGVEKTDEGSAKRHAVEFVVELQKLFAAMALGNQNCVDPSGVMHAMRDQEGNPIVIGAQQDASEFNHLFLDIVERGLKSASTKESTRDMGIQIEPVTDAVKKKDGEVQCEDRMEEGDVDIASTSQNSLGGRAITEEVVRMDESQGEGTSGMVTADGEKMEADLNDDVRNASNVRKAAEKNIVKEMFTMRFRQELQSCGEVGSMNGETTGGQAKMTVNVGETNAIIVDATTKEYRNLYSGLDDFTYAYVDTVVSEEGAELGDGKAPEGDTAVTQGGPNKGVKRVWFTRMAPVVVIYLQRVRYNRDIFQAEKVYDRYDFETNMSLDRYMEENKREASRAREEVFKLREEMGRVKEMLKKMKEFPTEMEGKESVAQKAGQVTKEEFSNAIQRVEMRLTEAIRGVDDMFNADGVSEERIRAAVEVIRSVMERDAKVCKKLESTLKDLESAERRAYEGLDGTKYRLHGVLVHDGAPSGGHYWTFIRNWGGIQGHAEGKVQKGWMKLSDSVVSEVTEEEMLEWAVGGKSLASAYCLIYVSVRGTEQGMGGGGVDGKSPAEESRVLLPKVRIEEVETENERFNQEVLRVKTGKQEGGA